MARPKKTEAELQTTRELILDTTYALLEELGPQALTSRAIAERIGVAHMSLYTYFENQPAIISALTEREMARWRDRQAVIEQRADTEDITVVMQEALQFFIQFALENPNLYHLAWVLPELGMESIEHNRQRMQSNVALLARLIGRGIEQGVFEKRAPFLAAATVLGMVNMPFVLFHTGKMMDPKLRDLMVGEVLIAAMRYLKE